MVNEKWVGDLNRKLFLVCHCIYIFLEQFSIHSTPARAGGAEGLVEGRAL